MISVASVAPRRRFLRLPPLPLGKYRRRHPFAFLRPFAVYARRRRSGTLKVENRKLTAGGAALLATAYPLALAEFALLFTCSAFLRYLVVNMVVGPLRPLFAVNPVVVAVPPVVRYSLLVAR